MPSLTLFSAVDAAAAAVVVANNSLKSCRTTHEEKTKSVCNNHRAKWNCSFLVAQSPIPRGI